MKVEYLIDCFAKLMVIYKSMQEHGLSKGFMAVVYKKEVPAFRVHRSAEPAYLQVHVRHNHTT